jgi:hypothetical protein
MAELNPSPVLSGQPYPNPLSIQTRPRVPEETSHVIPYGARANGCRRDSQVGDELIQSKARRNLPLRQTVRPRGRKNAGSRLGPSDPHDS